MTDIASTYADGRARITELVAGLTDDEAATPVPSCPEWTVHDVVAHVTGICADILAGNLEGIATEAWTAAQVEARRVCSMGTIADEWNEIAPEVEAFADSFPGRVGNQWIADLTTHEHDIRGALGRPGARDSRGMEIGLEFLVTTGLAATVTASGLGPLEVKAGQGWVVGSDGDSQPIDDLLMAAVAAGEDLPVSDRPPTATLEADAFELFRALTGRRSIDQVAALGWSTDPAPYLPLFTWGPFTPSATPNDE